MTDRLRSNSYPNSNSGIMANELSPRKTMFILVIVVGCFAVLWPKVFYPMLVGSLNNHVKPSPIDRTAGCCDVISDMDVDTIKIMSEVCSTIIKKEGEEEGAPLTGREIIARCRSAVLETCGIDISAVLQQQVRLGHTTKQILDQVRSMNGSLCLKYNFGVAPWKLGVPHAVKMGPSSSVRQERPTHLRSEMVHPAFKERGRAIPQTTTSPPSRFVAAKRVVEGRPGPIPAMRPTMGGPGHVVPPPKQGTGSIGLIMPIYTIGIIIFKKQPESLYPPVDPDPRFRKEVFESERFVNAMSALLDEVDQEMATRRQGSQVAEDGMANGKVVHQEEPSVKVMGMEMRASCEGGQKWSRPESPLEPHPVDQKPLEPEEPPQEIILEGSLPPQSHHLLVSDSATEAEKSSEEDPAVVLAGKMTLSVIIKWIISISFIQLILPL
nr:unnamed protein product [Callosobruchus chinensis]